MIPLYIQTDFDSSKPKDLLPCKCKQCNKTFKRTKHQIQTFLNPNHHATGDFCSKKCSGLNDRNKQIVNCLNCSLTFEKPNDQIKRSPNHFCSRSCSTTYRNTHKSSGTRRSKLEFYLEEQLLSLYPNLEFHFNRKDTINSELDIYIPSLKLAFELNGIFHYEPIYGSDKLNQIQNNDTNKFQNCIEQQISLCVIDTSTLINFKPIKAKKYFDIIVNIINQRTSALTS